MRSPIEIKDKSIELHEFELLFMWQCCATLRLYALLGQESPMVSENWWDCAQDALSSYCLVFDAVYTPKDTLLLKDAADVGAVTVSGEEMFFRQAFRQFQHFTNLSGVCLHYFQFRFIQCLVVLAFLCSLKNSMICTGMAVMEVCGLLCGTCHSWSD